MKDEELARIRKRLEDTTPGDWNPISGETFNGYSSGAVVTTRLGDIIADVGPQRNPEGVSAAEDEVYVYADAEFLGWAKRDITNLLAYVAELDAENAHLSEQIGDAYHAGEASQHADE